MEAAGHDEKKKDRASVSFVETEVSPRPGRRSSGEQGLDLIEEPIASADSLSDRRFESLDEVHDLLGELGLTDSKYKLNNDGFAVMPGKRHNRGTKHLGKQLDGWNKGWSKGWLGSWGEVSNDNVMQVPGFTPSGRHKQREPDVAFWAYPRCEKIDGTYVAMDRPDGANFDVDPDVVFQFSDGNTFAKEEEAMNLIMIGGIGAGNEGPRVGFLLKLREVAGNTMGIDIYKVPHGRTVADAMNQANGATHIVYTHGQAADVIIETTPEEMGIDGIWTHLCPSFKLSMKKLWAAGHF
mmetsp:Transcript_14316/g.39819  ORF Transcript_14316/g.39819 Transcript_14316/m.39819 type:complete len:295 (+) Transcript_14316:100-984(+)